MAKYIIDIPNTGYVSEEDGQLYVPLKSADCDVSIKPAWLVTGYHCEPYTESNEEVLTEATHEGYLIGLKEGREEAWEFAKTVSIMKPEDKRECWGTEKYNTINLGYSYQEAKDRYEAWKKQKDEIRVGDEIYSDGDYEKSVVMEIYGDGSVSVYTKNGCIEHWWNKMHNLKKTGRHFDEIEELLKKMREVKNDNRRSHKNS